MKPITILQKTWKPLLTLLLGVWALLFWGNTYYAHLAYQEQYQLFLFDADYWWERVAVPGGVADYVAEFLTQFYYYPRIGACILAVLFMLLQTLTWKLSTRQGAQDFYYPLSFLPVLFLWRFMSDESTLLSFGIAWLLTLSVACLYAGIHNARRRLACAVICIPLLYWMAGPVHFVFTGWALVLEWRHHARSNHRRTGLSWGAFLLLWAFFAGPLLASIWMQYPLFRLAGGINYYRFPAVIPWLEIAVAVIFWLMPWLSACLPLPRKQHWMVIALQTAVIAGGGCYLIQSGTDTAKEEAMRYDQLVRHGRWKEVIRMAEERNPASPFGVTCLNLSLAMTGQMGDRMFEFYQNGTEGLLPTFIRDFTSPLPTSEAYYYLGMINTAQRFTFEAMEAIPNFRKSGRCYKRLAETNLINGQYKVAAKYLRALQKTLFYKDWATETMGYLYQEERINRHPEWGHLRQMRYTEDFLFSEVETDIMLGLLYQHNHHNRMAFEYMLAYVLQRRDLERFMQYYPLGKDAGYDHIPRSYQEALVYVWTQTHSNFRGMPWSIYPQVVRDITEFARLYTSQPNARQLLKARFGTTYWNYLLLKD